MPELKREVRRKAAAGKSTQRMGRVASMNFPPAFAEEIEQLVAGSLKTFPERRFSYRAKALLLLSDERFLREQYGLSGSHIKLSRRREHTP